LDVGEILKITKFLVVCDCRNLANCLASSRKRYEMPADESLLES
jgi:hypothetical protein